MDMDLKEQETGVDIPSSKEESEENILKKLCILEETHREPKLEELYDLFEISRRRVNFILRDLEERGYLELSMKDQVARLTETGRLRGMECRHRHDTLSQFLQFVGVGEETADKDACRMEHVVSAQTVQKLMDFVNYGETYERVIRNTDLSSRYHPGTYQFLMGIYQLEKRCPRSLAKEGSLFLEEVILQVEPRQASFLLRPKSELKGSLWFMDQEQAWKQARLENGCPVLPSDAFEFSVQQKSAVTEGTVLVMLVRRGEKQTDDLIRELNVHIW